MQFLAYLERELPAAVEKVDVHAWTEQPGLPDSASKPESSALEEVAGLRSRWLAGEIPVSSLPAKEWATQEWLSFLSGLPEDAGADRLAELDAAFRLSESNNAEILFRWLLESVKRGYKPADEPLEEFLTSVGRRKFLKPEHADTLDKLHELASQAEPFDPETLEAKIAPWVEETGIKMKLVAQPARVAMTGRTASPGLYETMALLGRDATLSRLKRGAEVARTPAEE